MCLFFSTCCWLKQCVMMKVRVPDDFIFAEWGLIWLISDNNRRTWTAHSPCPSLDYVLEFYRLSNMHLSMPEAMCVFDSVCVCLTHEAHDIYRLCLNLSAFLSSWEVLAMFTLQLSSLTTMMNHRDGGTYFCISSSLFCLSITREFYGLMNWLMMRSRDRCPTFWSESSFIVLIFSSHALLEHFLWLESLSLLKILSKCQDVF